jgi:hypothetical protein
MHLPVAVLEPDRLAFLQSGGPLAHRLSLRQKAGFAAHNRGDLDALTRVYAPDVVFETLLLGTHRGNEAIRLIYEENQKTLTKPSRLPGCWTGTC